MTKYPITPAVQEAYRSALGIGDSPSFIDTDTPVTPVAVIVQANTPGVAQFVKITDGTDNVSINTDGSINNTNVLKALTTAQQNCSNNTTTIITVAAGTKVRIYSFVLDLSCTAAGTVTLTLGATSVFILRSLNATVDKCVSLNLPGYIEVAAAGIVTISSGANCVGNVSLLYEVLSV